MSELYIPGLSGSTPFVANYPGDIAADVMSGGALYGPGRGGNRYKPVDARYNPVTGRTRVQFQPVPDDPTPLRQAVRGVEKPVRKAKKRRGKKR